MEEPLATARLKEEHGLYLWALRQIRDGIPGPRVFATEVLQGAYEFAGVCEHEWFDMRNSIIKSGESCRKCGEIRAGNTSTSSE